MMPYIAHLAFHLTAIGGDDGDVCGNEGSLIHCSVATLSLYLSSDS